MATGDVDGNLERLKAQLRSVGYPHVVDNQGLRMGLPSSILPLLHHILLGYSRHVARYLSTNGYELYAKSDLRFVECILKFLRTEFAYRCPLTLAQFFSRGFAERKMLFVHDVIQCCKRKHNELLKESRRGAFNKKSECGSGRFGSQRKPLRNENVLRHEEFNSSSLRITTSPKGSSKCRHSPKTCRLSVELSPTADSVHEADRVQPGVLKENRLVASHACRSSRNSSPCSDAGKRKNCHRCDQPPVVAAESEIFLNIGPADVRYIDSSLPRSLDTTGLDASLPRACERSPERLSRCLDSPLRRPDKSPERMDSPRIKPRSPSPTKLELRLRESPSRDDTSSPQRASKITPKPPMQDVAIPKDVAAITSCYDEIKQKIGEIGEKLDSRFGTLEQSLTKTTSALEARFGTLESRVSLLEKSVPAQAPCSPEPSLYCRKHSPKHDHSDQKVRSNHKHEPGDLHGVIRDISNMHQNLCDVSPSLFHRAHLSTQELIDSIKARCTRTKELLNGIY